MAASLRVVTSGTPRDETTEQSDAVSLTLQIHRLQAEAKRLAAEHVAMLVESLQSTQAIAEEVSLGGEAYHAGVRDLARRISEDNASKIQTLEAILGRSN